MNRILEKTVTVVTGLSLSLFASTTRANTFDTAVSTDSHNDAVDATAAFSISGNVVTLTLSDLLQNPNSAGDLISGINFDVSGATGPGTLGSSGNVAPITSDTLGAATFTSPLSRWDATYSGVAVSLTCLTGTKPNELIIGPDSTGDFNVGGKYTGSGVASISDNHEPDVLGSATFTVTIPGVTSTSVISDVVFEFGTGPDGHENGTLVPNVPDGSTTLSLLGLAFTGIALARRKMN